MKYENVLIQGRNYIRISGDIDVPGYMIEMLHKYKFQEMIECRVFNGSDGKYLLYETDAFVKLGRYLSENGLDSKTFRKIAERINNLFNVCSEYLLDADRIVFDPDLVFIRPLTMEIRFMYSFVGTNDIRQTVRNFLSRILGNYFSGFTIDDERFREWAVREISRKDFAVSRLLSCWYTGQTLAKKPVRSNEPEMNKQSIIPSIKKVWEKLQALPDQKHSDETIPIVLEGNGLYLNGLCSIDTKIPILEEGITIGRQILKQNYSLSNGKIGKSHARIYLVDNEAYITDLGSRNGTYLNGERLKGQQAERIERGDIVSFSDEEFILC